MASRRLFVRTLCRMSKGLETLTTIDRCLLHWGLLVLVKDRFVL